MKILLWIVGIIVGLFVLFMLFEYVIPSLLPGEF